MAGLFFAAIMIRLTAEILAPVIPLLVIPLVLTSLIAFILGAGRR